MLHRRTWLKRHWQQLYQWQQMSDELTELLASKELPAEIAERIQSQIKFLKGQLEPPVFDRPRQEQSRKH